MKLIDYYFYITYEFLVNKLGRSEEEAKWSTLLFSSLYLTLFIDSIVYCVGLLRVYEIIEYYSSLDFTAILIIDFLISILLYIRFYKRSALYKTENEYKEMSDKNKIIIKRIVLSLFLFIPIFWFVIGRMYIILSKI